jgi:plastocyanin
MKIATLAILLALLCAGCSKQETAPAPAAPAAPKAAAIKVDPASAGSISGVVTFKGAVPKLATLDMSADPGCPPKAQPAESALVKNGKLANAFVYVKSGLPTGTFDVPSQPVVLTQKGCRYQPRMMGIMVGQQFKVTNTDTADHNIHNMPGANPEWNESQMPTDPPIIKSFAKPEMMMVLQCNQHPWMRAYVNVMTHPYYAVSAEDGSFQIANLPPGEYTLVAVHEKFGEQTLQVKVGAKEGAKAAFTFAPQ